MSKFKYLIFLILLSFLISCKTQSNKQIFIGEFNGYWAMTHWSYIFFPNNKFKFKSEGHFGHAESEGKYLRKGDSLLLTPDSLELVKYGVVNPLYLIDGDSCIIDALMKYDYCKTRSWSLEREINRKDTIPDYIK